MFICRYCGKTSVRLSSNTRHENECKFNPDRRVQIAWNKGKTTKPRSEETKQKLSDKGKLRKQTDECKQKLSILAKNRNLGGTTQSRWIQYKGKTLGSSYEYEVAKSLDENNIKWDTCKRFNYIDRFGKCRTYTPDIYLIDYNVYLDPKNDFLINNINPRLGFMDAEKIQKAAEQNNIKVIILDKTQLKWETI